MRKPSNRSSRKVPARKPKKTKPLRSIKKIVQKIRLRRRPVSEKEGARMREAVKAKAAPAETRAERVFEPAHDTRLPSRYHEDRMVLLVRDPWWLFSYWEFTPWREARVLEGMRREGCEREKTVLRVYDVTGTSIESPNSFFDIEVGDRADNWYIDTGAPDREWVAEVGFRARGGRFFALVRSNAARTPRFGLSDVLDEEWMMPEEIFSKLFGWSAGRDQAGSFDIRKMLEKYLRNAVSSESSSGLPAKSR